MSGALSLLLGALRVRAKSPALPVAGVGVGWVAPVLTTLSLFTKELLHLKYVKPYSVGAYYKLGAGMLLLINKYMKHCEAALYPTCRQYK